MERDLAVAQVRDLARQKPEPRTTRTTRLKSETPARARNSCGQAVLARRPLAGARTRRRAWAQAAEESRAACARALLLVQPRVARAPGPLNRVVRVARGFSAAVSCSQRSARSW